MPGTKFLKEQALYTISRCPPRYPLKPEYSFDQITKYIKTCPAYCDPFSRVIIEKDCIYFGHSLQEIEVSFPGVRSFIISHHAKALTEENINLLFGYGYKSADAIMSSNLPIKEQQIKLKEEARDFFSNSPRTPTRIKKIDAQENEEPSELLYKLFDNYQTVVVGEVHSDKSSKKLLIDNMPQLKSRGVEVIYLEHVLSDTQQEMFEAYFASEGLVMPIMLANYLHYLDRGFDLEQDASFFPYSFTGLVVQAKRYGIKILPFDTVASYATAPERVCLEDDKIKDLNDRCLMMNYVAARQYNKNKDSHHKAIFFVGSSHINDVNSGVMGLDEITGGPSLVVEDKKNNRQVLTAKAHIAKPDFLICMNYDLSEEAHNLQLEYNNAVEYQKLQAENNVALSTPKDSESEDRALTKGTHKPHKLREFFIHHYSEFKNTVTRWYLSMVNLFRRWYQTAFGMGNHRGLNDTNTVSSSHAQVLNPALIKSGLLNRVNPTKFNEEKNNSLPKSESNIVNFNVESSDRLVEKIGTPSDFPCNFR